MSMPKRYDPQTAEPHLAQEWEAQNVYNFDLESDRPVYSIDTPPPTVSGHLHLGHVYSYSHTDFIARFWRMRGWNVYYPMGFDDNGLPTERLVEKRTGVTARQIGRQAFIEKCLQASEEAEQDYRALWQRLGLSIDWRYTYRSIDPAARRASQQSFLDLYRKGLIYRKEAPAIWCPECRTALAQADLNDLERDSEYAILRFSLVPEADQGLPEEELLIATTRPELLPACVAIFVHPDDGRWSGLIGRSAYVPLFDQAAPILADPDADPTKGTGAVMCCTFGDAADVAWQRKYDLPVIAAIDRDGRMTSAAGRFAGLPVAEARRHIKEALAEAGLLTERQPTQQTIRVHERCDTPVEYVLARQWFIRVLDYKDELLSAGERLHWRPEHMKARYRSWVEGLNWDWCITRQRAYGVPFPVWYCRACGQPALAEEADLPIDPLTQTPRNPCSCRSMDFTPDPDVMDTWATSSVSPQIAGHRIEQPELYARVFPFALRPQAHEIIRTWAFYTIVKSLHHFGVLPWKNVMISGWGIAGEGMGKISKSRGGGPMPPMAMIERYSADALRYWAASVGPGRDAVISEEKIQAGARLVTKLWNVAAFCSRFIDESTERIPALRPGDARFTAADRWILARLQSLIQSVTADFEDYDYNAARNEVEAFFWRDLADNYLEMVKLRLYDSEHIQRDGARFALRQALRTILHLFAPLLPYITEAIHQELFAVGESRSIHSSAWPPPDLGFVDPQAEAFGEILLQTAGTVRRYKSERSLPLGSELERLTILLTESAGVVKGKHLHLNLEAAIPDLAGVTRARNIAIAADAPGAHAAIPVDTTVSILIETGHKEYDNQ